MHKNGTMLKRQREHFACAQLLRKWHKLRIRVLKCVSLQRERTLIQVASIKLHQLTLEFLGLRGLLLPTACAAALSIARSIIDAYMMYTISAR